MGHIAFHVTGKARKAVQTRADTIAVISDQGRILPFEAVGMFETFGGGAVTHRTMLIINKLPQLGVGSAFKKGQRRNTGTGWDSSFRHILPYPPEPCDDRPHLATVITELLSVEAPLKTIVYSFFDRLDTTGPGSKFRIS